MALILVWSPKGGVGKTTIAYSICLDLDFYYTTNDPINSSIVLNSYSKTLQQITRENYLSKNIVYDGGGFLSEELKPILYAADLIIFPLEPDLITLASFNQILNEIKEYNKIYFVINKVENNKDFLYTKNFLVKSGIKETQILKLTKTKLFKYVLEKDTSVSNLLKNKIFLNWFKKSSIVKEYEDILKVIKMNIENK